MHGRSLDDIRNRRIPKKFLQMWLRLLSTPATGNEIVRKMIRTIRSKPFYDCIGRPFRGFVGMTIRTGIRGSIADRLIRPGNPEAVIVPIVIPHIEFSGHVTTDAVHLCKGCIVSRMLKRFIFRFMTLPANLCGRFHQLPRMRFMAVRTFYLPVKHLAL